MISLNITIDPAAGISLHDQIDAAFKALGYAPIAVAASGPRPADHDVVWFPNTAVVTAADVRKAGQALFDRYGAAVLPIAAQATGFPKISEIPTDGPHLRNALRALIDLLDTCTLPRVDNQSAA